MVQSLTYLLTPCFSISNQEHTFSRTPEVELDPKRGEDTREWSFLFDSDIHQPSDLKRNLTAMSVDPSSPRLQMQTPKYAAHTKEKARVPSSRKAFEARKKAVLQGLSFV